MPKIPRTFKAYIKDVQSFGNRKGEITLTDFHVDLTAILSPACHTFIN